VQFHFGFIGTHLFNGFVRENHIFAFYLESLFRKRFGNLNGIYRTEDLAGSAGFCADLETDSVHFCSHLGSGGLNLCLFVSALPGVFGKYFLGRRGCHGSKLTGNQKVLRISVFDGNDVVFHAKVGDILYKNNFHCY